MDKDKLKTLLIDAEMTVKQTMQKLNDTSKKILFVVDGNERLVGTITDGDIRRGIINGAAFSGRIGDLMHTEFKAVSNDVPRFEKHARDLMVETENEQIPVLDPDGVIVDVLLWTDFIEKKETKPKQFFENQVVIMAGGKGTRLDPFTKILPKPLIPIGNKPVIEIIMDRFYRCGFHKFVYTLNYKKEYLKLFLMENRFPYSCDWVEESDYLGTVGGLSLLKDKVKDTFFIANCDSILKIDFEKVLSWHKENGAAITIVGSHNEVKIPFGVLEIANGCLSRISEKPVHDVLINTGVYVMEPRALSYIPENAAMDMNVLIDILVRKDKVSVFPITEGWLDIGQWDEYKRAVEKLENYRTSEDDAVSSFIF